MAEYKLDVEYIKHTVQQILDKTHTDAQKRIIKPKSDRLSFACPLCGDSSKDVFQKRGHLFLNNLYYKCYNEDCRSTFTKLCKHFDVAIDINKKLDLINYIDTNFHAANTNNEFILDNLNKLIPFTDLQTWFDSGRGPLRGFKPIQQNSYVDIYLKDRKIPKQAITLMYEGIYYNNKYSEPRVVFVNCMNDKVIGMQERNLKTGGLRKFKIWTFKELYESIYETELDEIESIGYNKLSYLYNVLKVNFENKITVFEGYLDSLFMPNSIGAVGINTDYNFLIQNDLDIQFFFDNDYIGKAKSLQWLKKGYPVFLWEKLLNDLAKESLNPPAYKIWFNENIKDLNKLQAEVNVKWSNLQKYFSTSLFDTIWINPGVKPDYKKTKEINIHTIDWSKKIKELK